MINKYKIRLFSSILFTTILLVSCNSPKNNSTTNGSTTSSVVVSKAKISFDLNGGTTTSDTSSRYIETLEPSSFFFNVKKEGYNFRGWSFNGIKVFDEKGKQLANPALEEDMIFKAMFAQTVKMTIVSNIVGAGTISGEGEYSYNTYVDVSAKPNQGYDFVGWYFEDTLLSNTEDYKYMMWSDDVTLEARFKLANYVLEIHTNHEDYGTVLLKPFSEYRKQYRANRDYTTDVTIAAYSKTDVRFLGWYDSNNKLVETNAVYDFIMPNYDYTLEAKWNYFTITYVLNGGENNPLNPDYYTIDSKDVSLYNPTRPGYTFKGWKYGDSFVSELNPNWIDNITLSAEWDVNNYNLSVESEDDAKGTVSGSGEYDYNSSVTVTATPKTGYSFAGWYDGSTKVYSESTYTFDMPSNDYSLLAKFIANNYTLSLLSEDTSKGTVTGDGTYAYTSSVTVIATPKTGYSFDGWYDGSTKVSSNASYTFTMPANDYSLVAKFTINNYTLSVTSEDITKGTVTGSGSYDYNSSVTVTATPNDFYSFDGWYDGPTKVSSSASYTFNMPANDYSLVAKFYSNNVIYFGLYPQTHVFGKAVLDSLNALPSSSADSQGYYSYNGELYYPFTAKPCYSYTFEDGTSISSGTKYWFKVEPIEWKVLDDYNEYFITSTKFLDAHRYNENYTGTKSRTDYQGNTAEVYTNNYKYSEIRSWLNTDFYDMAFSSKNSRIKTTTVDNSLSTTTTSSSNPYTCEDTNDKVFLLSYRDYLNSSYGFKDNASRKCKPTDFALARGANYDSSSDAGNYWTRSPCNYDSCSAKFINFDGATGWDGGVNSSTCGVRPALKISH